MRLSDGVSSSLLHSIALRSVRWRSGRSRALPWRMSSRSSSRARSSSTEKRLTRAAASSIARGRPSSRRQIATRSPTLPSVTSNPGRTACARSTKSCTASDSSAAATDATFGAPRGSDSGGTGKELLAAHLERHLARRQDREIRALLEQLVEPTRRVEHVFAVVEHQQQPRVAEPGVQRIESRGVADRPDRQRAGDRREHPLGRTLSAEVDEEDAVSEAIDVVAASCRASRLLPVPPAPVSVRSRTPAPRSSSSWSRIGLAPDEARRLRGQVARRREA